jgi:hypothetical protein
VSKGAGIIERRIADLLAATRDRALSIDDITDHAFELAGAALTRRFTASSSINQTSSFKISFDHPAGGSAP